MRKKQVATVEEVGARLKEWRQSRQKGERSPMSCGQPRSRWRAEMA